MKILVISNEANPEAPGIIPDSEDCGLPFSLADIPNLSLRLRESGCDVQIEHHSCIHRSYLTDADKIILSGAFLQSALSADQLKAEYAGLIDFIKSNRKPLLGICMGMQLICMAFDNSFFLKLLPIAETGFTDIYVTNNSVLLNNVQPVFSCFEKHRCMIGKIPENFICCASSDSCSYQEIEHKSLPVFGTQFHPEIIKDRHKAGLKIIRNFISL